MKCKSERASIDTIASVHGSYEMSSPLEYHSQITWQKLIENKPREELNVNGLILKSLMNYNETN